MPFIAISRLTGSRIDLTTLDNPREQLQHEEPYCQICNTDFVLKAGLIKAAHFAHRPGCDCSGDYLAHPESPEHLYGKLFIRNYLRNRSDHQGAFIELEVPVDMDWRAKGRIVDVLVTYPMGWRIAHEIQLASITVEQLQERTNDYLRAGIDTCWWLGRTADTNANRDWCIQTFGLCLFISKFTREYGIQRDGI